MFFDSVYEGTIRHAAKVYDRYQDHVIYGLIKENDTIGDST